MDTNLVPLFLTSYNATLTISDQLAFKVSSIIDTVFILYIILTLIFKHFFADFSAL